MKQKNTLLLSGCASKLEAQENSNGSLKYRNGSAAKCFVCGRP